MGKQANRKIEEKRDRGQGAREGKGEGKTEGMMASQRD